MRKKFSLTLTFIIAIAMLIVTFFGVLLAVQPEASTAYAEGEHSHSGWTAWTSTNSLPTSDGNYYLTNDVTMTYTWTINANISLCLNNHAIKFNNYHDNNYSFTNYVRLNAGKTFNLYDEPSTTRYYAGGQTVLGHQQDAYIGTVVDQSTYGQATGRKGTFIGGYIYSLPEVDGSSPLRVVEMGSGSVFNMYGGTLIGAWQGVEVDGSFNMYGGNIVGCRYGIEDDSTASEITIYNGTFENNLVGISESSYSNGSTYNIFGGRFTNNQYGIITYKSDINIKGDVYALGNNNADISVQPNRVLNFVGPLTKKNQLGVYCYKGFFTNNWTTFMGEEDFHDYIVDNNTADGYIELRDNELFRKTLFEVKYNANGADSGTVPTQSQYYLDYVNIAGNSGNLEKEGYVFAGWNTYSNGQGVNYAPGTKYQVLNSINLYAKWSDKYIEFTTSVDGDETRYIEEDKLALEDLVTVRYKITRNSGVNSLLIVPDFDNTVFEIDSITVNNETSLGAATITDGDGTKKILLENTGDKYEAIDGEDEFFLTITYRIIDAKDGEYQFGLVMASEDENGKSEAYYIEEVGGQKGEQSIVDIITTISNSLEIVVKKETTITIGHNQEINRDEYETNYDYWYTYAAKNVQVTKVEELPEYEEQSEESNDFIVSYLFNGDADVSITWYIVDSEGSEEIIRNDHTYYVSEVEAPRLAGDYFVKISAGATNEYYAPETKYGYVHIVEKIVDVTIEDKTSEYKESIVPLTYTTSINPYEGDAFYFSLTTDATSTSDVGTYRIRGSIDENHLADNLRKYVFRFIGSWKEQPDEFGTYTITKKALTLTALNQTAEYTGNEPTVDQTKYTATIGGNVYEYGNPEIAEIVNVLLTKQEGVNVGAYTISINYTNENYDITLTNGTFTITSVGKDADYIKSFFSGDEKVYSKTQYDLLIVDSEIPSWIDGHFTASNNLQSIVDPYEITVNVNLDEQDALNYTNGQQIFVFTVDGLITPAPITIKAENHTHVYGNDPQTLSFVVTSGTLYTKDDLNVSYQVLKEEQEKTLNYNLEVGEYTIKPSGINSNYTITTQDGVYTVTKGTPTITINAEDIYYNRGITSSVSVYVGNIELDSNAYNIVYYKNAQEVNPQDAGNYVMSVSVDETDNYYAQEASEGFEIKKVRLEGVNFTYSHGNVTWTEVQNDLGKTLDEEGVDGIAIKDGTTITYMVYDAQDNLVLETTNREFTAALATTYKVVATSSNDNYLDSESVMVEAYEVSFAEGNHEKNPEGEVTNMPSTQYIFAGESAVAPGQAPQVEGCDFDYWMLDEAQYTFVEAVNGNLVIVAKWAATKYTITLKYVPESETVGVDVFTMELEYHDVVNYSELNIKPKKESQTAGIVYIFANKWEDTNNVEYTVTDGQINGFVVTGDMTFVALYTEEHGTYTITYFFSENGSTTEYTQLGDAQNVKHGVTIDYLTYDGDDYAWYVKDAWYLDAQRTQKVPTTMPAENISVYGTYKFNVGLGDVNADGRINVDDITLYRQWIVGGYDIEEIPNGAEWEYVKGGNYDAEKTYFLKRVADNNKDQSRDIRDVSITRMAIVGGYDWDILEGQGVDGASIAKVVVATTVYNLRTNLESAGRVRLLQDIDNSSYQLTYEATGDVYLDLGGHTLTVKSFKLTSTGLNATVKVVNGTIITTNGITIAAPNGNVILEDLVGYVNDSEVNLQAASNSLHLSKVVKFFKTEQVAAPVNIEKGTHVVVEETAEVEVEKIVVTENFVKSENASISLDNNAAVDIVVDGNISNAITTLSDLLAALENGGSILLGSDFTYSGSLSVTKDTTLNLNGYKLKSTNSSAICVKQGADLTISGGFVEAQEVCLLVVDGSEVTVNGGTYTSIDNFVVGTNGSTGRGANTITINNGIFNGGITSQGYVACGIYVANNDTVIVNGGTFNVTNGVGILARSGNTTVNAGVVFNVEGDGTLGKVGDSKVTVPAGAELVLDLAAAYPGGVPTLVNNGDFEVYTVINDLDEIIDAMNAGGNYVLAGDITYNGSLPVTKDTTINLNGHKLKSVNASAICVQQGAHLTISGGFVEAQEVCLLALDGSKVTVNGGTYTSIDNFVVGTNGSTGRGNNTIIINAGTFNGGIQSAGYVACGIYVANNDTVTVNGGTFNVTNGVGILARSGNTTVNEDVVFNVTGNESTGKVGDSKVTVPAGAELVLDLAAAYPGGDPTLVNNGVFEVYTVINDLDEIIDAMSAGGNYVLAGDMIYEGSLAFYEDTKIVLNGHTIKSTNNVAIKVTNGATLVINGEGNVIAQEMCAMAFSGSTLIINGGTFTAYDNAVIGTNGSSGQGGNTITINGGTFNGGIQSAGYVACGIYVANDDTVTVNGGTFNITNGVGILARSGNTTVNDGVVFNVEGDGTLGKVGDSKITVPAGEDLVLDLKAAYPGGTPTLTNNTSYDVYTIEA